MTGGLWGAAAAPVRTGGWAESSEVVSVAAASSRASSKVSTVDISAIFLFLLESEASASIRSGTLGGDGLLGQLLERLESYRYQ